MTQLTRPIKRSLPFIGIPGLTCLLLFPLHAFCADLDTLKPVCETCHGTDGISTNSVVPSIAGQAYTLIEDNLLAFRDTKNACSGSEFMHADAAALLAGMCAVLSNLGDEDISVLADYYESLSFAPSSQLFNTELVSEGERLHQQANCEQCHSQGGSESNGMASILAGQWSPYLESALLRIRAGEKKGPKVMNLEIMKFNDSDINALVSFYASQQSHSE